MKGASDFTAFNGELYFSGHNDPVDTGTDLWKVKADGSVVQAADINPGAMPTPNGFTAFNDELYFAANDGTTGRELWKVKADGSVVQAADIEPGRDQLVEPRRFHRLQRRAVLRRPRRHGRPSCGR